MNLTLDQAKAAFEDGDWVRHESWSAGRAALLEGGDRMNFGDFGATLVGGPIIKLRFAQSYRQWMNRASTDPKYAEGWTIIKRPPVETQAAWRVDPFDRHLDPIKPTAEHGAIGAAQAKRQPLTAPEHLKVAQEVLETRGVVRDKPKGERSMAQAVTIFNAMTGLEMTEENGWKFMIALKFARMQGGNFRLDDFTDVIGYSALLTECAEANS